MGDLTTFKRILSYIPGLTEYRFKMARQHSLQYGRGAEIHREKSLRMRVEKTQLDHFLARLHNKSARHPGSPIWSAVPTPLLWEDTRNSKCHQNDDSQQASKAVSGFLRRNKFYSVQLSNYAKSPVCLCSYCEEISSRAGLYRGRWCKGF